ncbi:TerC family protein [Ectothiorhodospiraceae bacterium WFHF3C12]|nr:TerC family protein [Ectothiorhodospiraceae bacterium WFHF3C12]
MFEWIASPEAWVALMTLTVMEVVLGIDNIIFISILADRLPAHQQAAARKAGLLAAMGARLVLLLSLSWLMTLTAPLFTLLEHDYSGRDLILMAGGLFLLGKATLEIHDKLEEAGEPTGVNVNKPTATFAAVVAQIGMLDLVFSLDSVITAIGMAEDIMVMVIAIVIAVIFMMVMVGPIHGFIQQHPTVKMLALSFLLLIGVALVGEGMGFHIPKGYIYFAMAFSAIVEMLNLRLRVRRRRAARGQT